MLTFLYAFLGTLTALVFVATVLVGARRSIFRLLLALIVPRLRIRSRNRR